MNKEKKYIVTKSQLQRLVKKALTIQDLGIKEENAKDDDFDSSDKIDNFMAKKFGAKAKEVYKVINAYNKEVKSTLSDLIKLSNKYGGVSFDEESVFDSWVINTESEGY